MDAGRVQKELKEIDRDKASGVSVTLKAGSLKKLTGYLEGPKDTPYENGFFVVDIELDDQYPFVPPKMKFVTKVWHPNISSASGAICLDILKDAWSPALTLKTALLSLQALLASPEPGDPQDAVVARQYLSEHATWEQTAKAWTTNYATREAACAASADKVAKLTDMGFDAAAAAEALRESGGDEQAALESLLARAGT